MHGDNLKDRALSRWVMANVGSRDKRTLVGGTLTHLYSSNHQRARRVMASFSPSFNGSLKEVYFFPDSLIVTCGRVPEQRRFHPHVGMKSTPDSISGSRLSEWQKPWVLQVSLQPGSGTEAPPPSSLMSSI